jgi:hypothetical protein
MTSATLEARKELGTGPLSERFDEALSYAARHHGSSSARARGCRTCRT